VSLSGEKNTRINNGLPVAREGIPFILIGFICTLFFIYIGLLFAAILLGIVTIFIISFFRDPDRANSVHDDTVLTPADGKILDIRYLEDRNNPLDEPAVKVSIFMSIFNVHVNRVPTTGRISDIIYSSGKFFSASLDKASEHNENNSITIQTNYGRKIVFVQIAGIIARRIVCWLKESDNVIAGQRCGLIRFGSRVEIYLPSDSRIIVQPRDKVKAGKTILGYLP
jgi:phosphatidylserine decarboxylase